MRALKTLLLAAALAGPVPVAAQVMQQQPRQQQERPDPADTIPVPAFRFDPPVSPLGAFGRSLLLPGWGQAVLGGRGAGAFFVFWEGLALTMTVKSVRQLHYQERIGVHADSLTNKRAEVEDWIALIVFNHLVAGAEAFVSAHLWDFPADLAARKLPGGAVGFGVELRLGRRTDPIRETRGAMGRLER